MTKRPFTMSNKDLTKLVKQAWWVVVQYRNDHGQNCPCGVCCDAHFLWEDMPAELVTDRFLARTDTWLKDANATVQATGQAGAASGEGKTA